MAVCRNGLWQRERTQSAPNEYLAGGHHGERGFEAIADEVARLEPDIVLFSEVRNYHGKQFISRILQALEERGKKYYGENSKLDVGILSKYKIEEQAPNCPLEDDAGSVLKARIRINGRDVVVYSAHLDYTHYACYLPRGYSGVTWKNWMLRCWMR